MKYLPTLFDYIHIIYIYTIILVIHLHADVTDCIDVCALYREAEE